MHEMSVAVALLERVQKEAGRGGLRSVSRMRLDIGALQAVEPELLKEAFGVIAEGTLAQGAELDIHTVEARARCRNCNGEYRPLFMNYACPACSQADPEILEGRDLLLASLTGEERDKEESHV